MKIIFIYFVNILLYDFIQFLFSKVLIIFLFEMYIVHVFLLLIEMAQLTQMQPLTLKARSILLIFTAYIQIRLSFRLRLKF